MSQENVETVRELLDAFNRRRLASLVEPWSTRTSKWFARQSVGPRSATDPWSRGHLGRSTRKWPSSLGRGASS